MTRPLPSKPHIDLPPLPTDLYDHLRGVSPQSYHFGEELIALNDLAKETGHRALSLDDINPPFQATIIPEGFTEERVIVNGAEIPTNQFKDRILSLRTSQENLTLDVHELRTDAGFMIRHCDLRPFMTSQVQGASPGGAVKEGLDRAFLRDIKFFAETKRSKNTVTTYGGANFANYTKLNNSLHRAYWMPVTDEHAPEGVVTVARIADCSDKPGEAALYRRVFGIRLVNQ